ncbi:MAG: 1,4-dihydroxy-2-naphthoate octaprenyltransferase [Bacteroidota bacterium]|nr:1,4-dihydroxy-2-naphthoate octaprenyltransferase [Bacteroidota bacterium]
MSSIQNWISAARPRTLPLAVSGIIMGNFLAFSYKKFDLTIAFISILTAVFLQILSNLANDYGDTQHGADNELRSGPSRAVQSGAITASQMKVGMAIAALLSLTSGLFLIYFSFGLFTANFNIFLTLGLLSIVAAYSYTAGILPYGYKGLGDLSVFLFFGPVAVAGSYFLQTHNLDILIFLPALSVGLLSVAVLNLNNMRDVLPDAAAGKVTIPLKLGLQKAGFYHFGLILFAFLGAITFHILIAGLQKWMLFLVTIIIFGNTLKVVLRQPEPQLLDPLLKKTALGTLAFVLLFGIGIII